MEAIDWDQVEEEAASLLSRYIQFDTTNPPGNEAQAIEFLADTLSAYGFSPQIINAAPGRANLIVRLKSQAQRPALPCLLYAHADVVPADADTWSVPPFGGLIKDGYIWGRGALDDKGLGVIFLQVLILLKRHGPSLNRDIILLIGADEEVSGRYGAAWLLEHHPELLNAEYVWDEGGMGLQRSNGLFYLISIAEKISLTVKLTACGASGHASIPGRDNALARLVQALYRIKRWVRPIRLTPTVIGMLQTLAGGQSFPLSTLYKHVDKAWVSYFLRTQLQHDPEFSALICDTISLTMVNGGVASNVIPAQAEAKLDVRLLPDEDPASFLAALRSVISDPEVLLEVENLPSRQSPTPADTPFFEALSQTLRSSGPPGQILPYLTPSAANSRFFRAAGMKAYGFTPMLLDAAELSRIHSVDERLSLANLRWGIQVVFDTLKKL